QKLVIDGAEGDDQFYVLSTGQTNPADGSLVDLTLFGGLGSDTFHIGGDAGSVATGISGAVAGYSGTGAANSTDNMTVANADITAAFQTQGPASPSALFGDP